jgi:hypothetical protein
VYINHQNTEGLAAYNAGSDVKNIELTILTGPQVGRQHGSPQDVDYTIPADLVDRFLESWLPISRD